MTHPTDPANFPLLDKEHLKAMTGGDSALAAEVIEIFRQQADVWSRLLDPKADPSQWADAAHTLKGASLGIGAIRLAAVCERAEKAGRSEEAPSLTKAAVLLNDIRDVLAPTIDAAAKAAHDLTSSSRRSAS